jgi:hypothetical protein
MGTGVLETVLIDDRGRFLFRSIPPGDVIVTAQKDGFFDGAFGKRRANGQPLPFSLVAGQAMSDMKIEVFRAGVITGSVLDDHDEPIIGARVSAFERQFVSGAWRYVEAGYDITDDNGVYRIFGLKPGEYLATTASTLLSMPVANDGAAMLRWANATMVLHFDEDAVVTVKATGAAGEESHAVTGGMAPALAFEGRERVYANQFYPHTEHRLLALPIPIAAGEVRYAVNFRLPLVPVFSVSGRLVGTEAQTRRQLVRLLPAESDVDDGDDTAITSTREDGTFIFVRVPRGRYRIVVEGDFDSARRHASVALGATGLEGVGTVTAMNAIPNPPVSHWAHADVMVDDDDVDVGDVVMRQAVGVMGSISLERDRTGTPSRARVSGITLGLAPAGPGLSAATSLVSDVNGVFAPRHLVPGRYYVRVGAIPPGWFLKSVQAGGHNVMDMPVDITEAGATIRVTLSERTTELVGTVRDSRMIAASGAAVIVMPVTPKGEAVWAPNRTRETRASVTGVFAIEGLPPGEYLVVAIDDAQADGWQDPQVMAALRTMGTRLTLRDQGVQTMQIRLGTIKR